MNNNIATKATRALPEKKTQPNFLTETNTLNFTTAVGNRTCRPLEKVVEADVVEGSALLIPALRKLDPVRAVGVVV